MPSDQQSFGPELDANAGTQARPAVDLGWVTHAFAFGPRHRDDLLEFALNARLHPSVLEALRALPSREYEDLDDLRRGLERDHADALATVISMRPQPEGERLGSMPGHVLITRGRGRLARLAASNVTRSLENAGIKCTRLAPEHGTTGSLDPRADMVARTTELVVGIGDAYDRALNLATAYDVPVLALDTDTSMHRLAEQLHDATVIDVAVVAVAAELAAPHWRTPSLTITTLGDGMRIEPVHGAVIRVAGAAVVKAVSTDRSPRLSVDVAARKIRCGEVTFRASGTKLQVRAESHEFTARRVVATPELRVHVQLSA